MIYLDDFLREEVREDIAKIIMAISLNCVTIWKRLPFSSDLEGSLNPSGEPQTKIDVYANDRFVSSILETGVVSEVISEEMKKPRKGSGSLHVSMDPLDGSSNISTNNPLGSIFGIYSSDLPCSGNDIESSAFVTYGPMLTLTFSIGKGVHRFVMVEEGTDLKWVLLDRDITMPKKPEVFGFGGLRKDWIVPIERFVDSLEKRGMKLRYGGTFVGDYNQILKYGGIFGYPALKNKPRGKLRILYETAPMAFITEEAGGRASDGYNDILTLEPKELTESSPAYLGDGSLVSEVEALIRS
jgi:fructose-1,6-bisphosphatase I